MIGYTRLIEKLVWITVLFVIYFFVFFLGLRFFILNLSLWVSWEGVVIEVVNWTTGICAAIIAIIAMRKFKTY